MYRKLILVLGAVIVAAGQFNVWAQTGTRIRDGGGKAPEIVVWFNEPSEVTDIRLLLQQGRKQLAVEKARAYVTDIENLPGGEAQVRLYFGLSALCSALTSTGEWQEAIDACTRAIGLFPSRWQAFNNRGVAHYMSGQFDKAMQDYRQALSLVQDSEPIVDLIEHNIGLANARATGRNP
jgi:Flp pilus assembly protein TadD